MDDAALTCRLLVYLSGIPGWEWRPTGPAYTTDETGLFYGPIGDTPDRAIGVRVYATDDDRYLAQRRAQIRIRGRAHHLDDADTIAGIAHTALDGLSRVAGILSARRISMSPLGADGNSREERTENYLITLDNMEAIAS
ncbi:phage tail terminator protein [Microbacterium excoecariae]|uniref:phage tail terminator protein n=1 Tax=Microbacterium excoecariae TaxID=2715210 RepID=UPI00140A6061|nr:hypothetical protein [Microbacterium excoecariae]